MIPVTAEIVSGWCGPGVLIDDDGREFRATIVGDGDGLYLLDGDWLDYNPAYLPVLFDEQMGTIGTLYVDTTRSEVEDRLRRVNEATP